MGSLERVWEVSWVSGGSLGRISIQIPGSGILEACLGGLWGSLEVSWRSLRGIWEVSGKSPERLLRGFGEASGRLLGGIWEDSGRHLGVIWHASGIHLGVIWQGDASERHVGRMRTESQLGGALAGGTNISYCLGPNPAAGENCLHFSILNVF